MKWLAAASVVITLLLSAIASSRFAVRAFSFIRDIPGQDRTGHFVVMGLLCLCVNLGFADARIAGRRLGTPIVTLLVFLGVTLEEYTQALIPRRSFDPLDLLAGYAGIAIAAVAVARPWRSSKG